MKTSDFFGVLIFLSFVTSQNIDSAGDASIYDDSGQISGFDVISQRNGYMSETHTITTEDGYIVEFNRIPNGKFSAKGKKRSRKKIVLLIHGLFGSSVAWIINNKTALPFLLADEGFDVWLWNARGTLRSSRHVNLTDADPAYWTYTFHEHGMYDIPAIIDYALRSTGQKDLAIIGHSNGGTIGFAFLSLHPEYNKKVRIFICYAPSVYVSHSQYPAFRLLANNGVTPEQFYGLFKAFGLYSIPGVVENFNYRQIVHFFCRTNKHILQFCIRFIIMATGFSEGLLQEEFAWEMIKFFPNRQSVREMIHYYQMGLSGRFALYDMGQDNLKIYGQPNPPDYPISSIDTPVAFYYPNHDEVVVEEDYFRLINETKNVVGVFKVDDITINHADFALKSSCYENVYKPTVALLKKF